MVLLSLPVFKAAADAGAVAAALTFMQSSRENGKVKTIRIHEKASIT